MEYINRGDLMRRARGITEGAIDLALTGTGVFGGLLGGKYIGDTVEQILTEPVTETSSMTDKLIAWLGNNVPKGLFAYLLTTEGMRSAFAATEELGKIADGITYGLAGSIVVDTYARSINKGIPTEVLDKSDTDRTQALLRENAELKQALQKLSNKQSTSVIKVGASGGVPNRPLEEKYQFTENQPEVTDKRMPIHEKYDFAEKDIDVTAPEVLSKNFGFLGV